MVQAAGAAGAVASAAGAVNVASGVMGALSGIVGAISALGPQSGLVVTPVVFQSVEQEGRWKPEYLVAPTSCPGRNFTLNRQLSNAGEPLSALGSNTFLSGTAPEYFGGLTTYNQTLFTVSVSGTTTDSKFSVDATWWADGLEIWAGFAGLATALNFTSVLTDMAAVTMYAMPFGNYYPASVLIAWAGWVNPVGPKYLDYRGAVVLTAGGVCSGTPGAGIAMPAVQVPSSGGATGGTPTRSLPAYMTFWGRGSSETPQQCQWAPGQGFQLST